jgi:allophanate hydrolase subunit 2
VTVYVDDIGIQASVTNPDNNRIHTSRWCHLFTDQDDQTELHELAKRIGLQRRWFQDHHEDAIWMWHYDVTESKRRLAVRYGAKEITWREAGHIMIRRAREARAVLEGS